MSFARHTLSFLLVLMLAAGAHAEGLSLKVLTGLESKRPRVRIAAVVAVQKSGDKKARRILEGMLGDRHAGDARVAVALHAWCQRVEDYDAWDVLLSEYEFDGREALMRRGKVLFPGPLTAHWEDRP